MSRDLSTQLWARQNLDICKSKLKQRKLETSGHQAKENQESSAMFHNPRKESVSRGQKNSDAIKNSVKVKPES